MRDGLTARRLAIRDHDAAVFGIYVAINSQSQTKKGCMKNAAVILRIPKNPRGKRSDLT
jgi:hypothetical protein